MKKLLRKAAYKLLRASGYNIPDQIIENVVEPYVLTITYKDYPTDMPDAKYKLHKDMLLAQAESFIFSEVTQMNGYRLVKLNLVVQRADYGFSDEDFV